MNRLYYVNLNERVVVYRLPPPGRRRVTTRIVNILHWFLFGIWFNELLDVPIVEKFLHVVPFPVQISNQNKWANGHNQCSGIHNILSSS